MGKTLAKLYLGCPSPERNLSIFQLFSRLSHTRKTRCRQFWVYGCIAKQKSLGLLFLAMVHVEPLSSITPQSHIHCIPARDDNACAIDHACPAHPVVDADPSSRSMLQQKGKVSPLVTGGSTPIARWKMHTKIQASMARRKSIHFCFKASCSELICHIG